MGSQSHSELKNMVQMTRQANDKKYEAHSRNMLKKHIQTKFKTTMIGALSRFEELFGDLWGHGLSEHDLDEDQRYWREKWQLARTEILNNGNNQLRASLNEVEQYNVKFNKNEYKFNIGDKKGLIEND